jgi:hypothetical protein
MVFGFYRGEQAVSGTKPLVPPFLVEMDVPGIDLFKEPWIPDMQLVRRYSYDGAWQARVNQANQRQSHVKKSGHVGRMVKLFSVGRVATYHIRRGALLSASSTVP